MEFTWKPFYKEFATKLLEYKNNRQELIDKIYSALDDVAFNSGTSFVGYLHKNGDRLSDIDPFSVYAIFNRSFIDNNRIECIKRLKEAFEIQADVPNDFNGIPVVSPMKSVFYPLKSIDPSEDISVLWTLFEKMMKNQDFGDEYDSALKINGVNINLSMALFWINPDRFLPLDQNTRTYIQNEFGIKDKGVLSYNEYQKLISQMKEKLSYTFEELSYKAWMYSKQNETTNITSVSMDEKYKKYVDLLRANHNIVLTGAPGTGKTYLAKQIAKQMNAEYQMVQFHPSYDYTDFVEGLRPKQNEGDGNIGFELKRGSFKEFCVKALENLIDSKKSSQDINADTIFRNAYHEMIDKVRNEELTEIPLKSSNMSMKIVEVSDNNNLILKAKNSDTGKTYTVSYNRLRKLSLSYTDIKSLDSITNINNAVRDSIGGCHTSAYWATLYYLYKYFFKPNTFEVKPVERKNYVFIIDEINRGEISKIFGELFFSIDPGYRGKSGTVQTQYQNLIEDGDIYENGFYVPENVYIIGTMNDIDRSVESMDFAMRRRFTWVEINAESQMDMLDQLGEKADEAKMRLKALNQEIDGIDGLGKAYHIGPAYFLKLKKLDWNKLWEYHLEPLLKEYLRGYRDVEKHIESLKSAFDSYKQQDND